LSKWLRLARKSSKKLLAFPLGNSEKKGLLDFQEERMLMILILHSEREKTATYEQLEYQLIENSLLHLLLI
jgi:hypothetical protein